MIVVPAAPPSYERADDDEPTDTAALFLVGHSEPNPS